MASEWKTTTIGQQVTLQRGIDITRAQQRPGIVPVVSSGGISSYHDTTFAKSPGVILGRKGTLGTVFYMREDYWPHDTTLWVRDFHNNDPHFVYYFFKSIAPDLLALDVGSANPALNRNHVHPGEVQWPEIDEQHAIVRILSALDDKIELNCRMNHTREAMAAALFKAWFVDFDPVTAKAEDHQPYGMNAQTAALFPTAFQDSEMGPIPQGWEAVSLPDLFDINPVRKLSTDEVAPYLDMANMPTSGHSPETWIERPVGSGMRFTNGDTLVARITPCLENGKTAYVDFLVNDQIGWGSTEYIVLRPKPPLPTIYAYCLARTSEFREFAIQSMTGQVVVNECQLKVCAIT